MWFDCQYYYRSSGKTLLRMLTEFAEYCEPRTQIIHERFSMIVSKREVKVSKCVHIRDTLCVIVKSCAHDEITPGEIVSDRFALGVRDEKIRELDE